LEEGQSLPEDLTPSPEKKSSILIPRRHLILILPFLPPTAFEAFDVAAVNCLKNYNL
jgi:hypothetical protein